MYFVATKSKSAKKGKKGPADATKKPIKHNAETFKLFDSLKLDAPITTNDIPPLLEKLEKQMEEYQAKVKEWEENKESMKKKILDGIITVEDIQAKEQAEKDAKKEAEKGAEKEEEKEEEKEAEKEEEKEE